MRVVRRRLFWKIYLTLLASLIATTVLMGAFSWFLGETQREGGPRTSTARHGPADVSLYAADGRLIGARGRPITLSDYDAGHNWGPNHVSRIELPDGRFVLTRVGPPLRARALRLLSFMLALAAGIGLAAYPVTALLTRRLEALRVGVAHWGEVTGRAQLDESGHDEVALLARTFNAAAARLEALLASQKALLANASHELRSPLARLRVAIEVGSHDLAAASRAEIVQNLAEIDQLVGELLLSSRLDHADTREGSHEPIDILGLVAEEAARYDAIVTGEPVEIEGDRVLLRRLMRNLLENGARHGRPPISIVVERDATGALVTVSDAGAGIPAADRERIFEPFYRPAGAIEGAGGWGLGLALVRQIAERHGGRAQCVATPSGGSCFVVHLGRSAAAPRAS